MLARAHACACLPYFPQLPRIHHRLYRDDDVDDDIVHFLLPRIPHYATHLSVSVGLSVLGRLGDNHSSILFVSFRASLRTYFCTYAGIVSCSSFLSFSRKLPVFISILALFRVQPAYLTSRADVGTWFGWFSLFRNLHP